MISAAIPWQLVRQRKISTLYLLLVLSFFFQAIYIEVGFALKAFYLMAGAAWLFLARGRFVRNAKAYELIFVFFLALYSATGLYSYDPAASVKLIIGIFLMIIVYLMTKAALMRLELFELPGILVRAGLIFNAISTTLYAAGIAKGGVISGFEDLTVIYGVMYDRGIPRLVGPVKDPNFFVMFCSIFFFLGLYFFRSFKFKALFFWSFLNIALTFSRGGALALMLGLAFYVVFLRRKRITRTIQIFGAIALAVGLVWWLMPDAQSFLTKRLESAGSASGRFEIWQHGWQAFLDHPYTGIGIFSFLQYNIRKFGGEHYMHNTYLEVLVEGGMFAFALYALFWAYLMLALFRAVLAQRGELERALGASIFCSLVVVAASFASISAVINEYFVLMLALASVYLAKLRIRA